MVKLYNAFPVRTAHPAVGELDAGAGRLDHGPDQQFADENSVRRQSRGKVVASVAGDRPAEQGQDVKTKDHVLRMRGVLHSLAVRLRDDAEFATNVHDARHSQTHSRASATIQ